MIRAQVGGAVHAAQVVADDRRRDAGEKAHEGGVGLDAWKDAKAGLFHRCLGVEKGAGALDDKPFGPEPNRYSCRKWPLMESV
jgi:hypothetical protein